MFDRFISLARAKKALHEERYLDALQQASAPLIREHRRAGQIRLEATQQLIRRARTCLEAGDTVTALAQAERLQQLSDGEAVTELVRVATEAASFAQIAQGEVQAVCNEFRRLVDAGDLSGAESLLVSTVLSDGDRERMTNLVAVRRKEAIATLDRAIVAASEVRFGRAIDGYLQATSIDTRISSSAVGLRLGGGLRNDGLLLADGSDRSEGVAADQGHEGCRGRFAILRVIRVGRVTVDQERALG